MQRLAAASKDIEILSRLRICQQKDDWGKEYSENDEELYKVTKKFLQKNLNKSVYIFVEEREKEIIATCGIQIIYYLPQCTELSGKVGYICNVYTDDKFRNQGIQTKLTKEVIRFARKNNVKELVLDSDKPAAVHVYSKLGFKPYDFTMNLMV